MSESPEKTPETSEEGVPESGTPPEESPDSSERSEEAKITTAPVKKEKDPKKVAQGKRLAQISKAAKEKKMRDKIENETKVDFSVDYKSALYIAGSASLVNKQKLPEPGTLPNQRPEPGPSKKEPKKFVSLFD